MLIGDIVITAWAVAGRYIPFITDPHWSEEIVLTLMVYMAVLSATLAIRKRAHIRMTAFDKYLPQKALMVSDVLADLAVLALGGALANGIDRVRFGYVVDMFEVEFMRFAVFNLADSVICVAAFLYAVLTLLKKEDRSPRT